MGLTFERAHKLHKDKWGHFAKTGNKDIYACPNWESMMNFPNRCSACAIAKISCRFCPIKWDNGKICSDNDSYFQKWRNAKTPKTRKKYAAIIRDMPWRKK